MINNVSIKDKLKSEFILQNCFVGKKFRSKSISPLRRRRVKRENKFKGGKEKISRNMSILEMKGQFLKHKYSKKVKPKFINKKLMNRTLIQLQIDGSFDKNHIH